MYQMEKQSGTEIHTVACRMYTEVGFRGREGMKVKNEQPTSKCE